MEILKKNDGDSQKNDGDFQKNDGLFPKNLPRFSDFVGDNRRNKGEKRKTKSKKEYTKRHQRQKQKESTTKTERHPRQNKSTTKTKRIPDKIGRKEGQFVPKNKDLRSKILMQTLHFRPKNLVKRIIYCNFVHYKWAFLQQLLYKSARCSEKQGSMQDYQGFTAFSLHLAAR